MVTQTVWRPYPFSEPFNKFDNAHYQRQQGVELLNRTGRPRTMTEIAHELGIEGMGFYNKARRYVMPVADPTHQIKKPRGRPDIGWTLKPQYQKGKS